LTCFSPCTGPSFTLRSMNPPSFRCALCLALCGAIFLSCGKPGGSDRAKSDEAPARAVRVARAETRPMDRTLNVVGTLVAHREATVAAQVAGQIEQILVDVGDHVKTGRELARIDTAAHAALARQSAANLAKAIASAANAEQILKRVRALQQERIASSGELDQAVADAEQARAEVEAVRAADAVAQLNLDRSRVKAPFDGAVASRLTSAGNYVAIGTPIIRLVESDPLRMRLDVPERESILVRPGQPVRLRVEGDTNIYEGQITRLAPTLNEASRMLRVEADVPVRGSLRPGLFARAEVIVDANEEGLSVPADALIVFSGIEKVVVVREGKAREINVRTGRRGSGWVEILSGIGPGDAVVSDPAGLHTGQPVNVTEPAEESLEPAASAGFD